MKKKILISLLIGFMILTPISAFAEVKTLQDYESNVTFKYVPEDQKTLDNIPEVGCKAVYIAEPTTGKVLYEKNAHEKMYPASTTKILTALVVLENCKLDETAIVSQNAIDLVPSDYTNAKLQAGESHTIKDLLYALLLPSANEAANVLAEHVSGTIEAFAEKCNQRAKELGCETLHFVNANGMHDVNHYCSAYDLYLIAKECKKYDAFNEIVKTKTYSLPTTDLYPYTRIIKNTNELLLSGTYYYANCTGIKTGHTSIAGECFVGSSTYNGLDLISVVLGGKEQNSLGLNERFYDTKQLCEFVYDNYSLKKIAEYGDLMVQINVGKATKDTAYLDVVVDADISTIVPNDIDKDSINQTVSLNDDIVAPIKQNQVLGQVTYYVDGLVYKTNIIASHEVEKLPYLLYNSVIVGVIVLTIIIFAILLKKCKEKKKAVIIIGIVIFVIEGIGIFFIFKEGKERTVTKTVTAENITANKKSDVDAQNI